MLKTLLSLFLNSNCPLCERCAENKLCKDCQRQLKSCQFNNPCQFWQGNLPLFAWGEYGGKLKQVLFTMKYNNHPELGSFMGGWLGETWVNYFPSSAKKIIVIPIPLHDSKLQERGFNQAELIAQGFCQLTAYSLMAKGLERVKKTEAMFGLNPTQREQNLKNAFRIGKALEKSSSQSPVLLLDDIYTMGTTVKEAAKTLRSHGVQVMGVVALSTPKQI